jgi:hypothetical protein
MVGFTMPTTPRQLENDMLLPPSDLVMPGLVPGIHAF